MIVEPLHGGPPGSAPRRLRTVWPAFFCAPSSAAGQAEAGYELLRPRLFSRRQWLSSSSWHGEAAAVVVRAWLPLLVPPASARLHGRWRGIAGPSSLRIGTGTSSRPAAAGCWSAASSRVTSNLTRGRRTGCRHCVSSSRTCAASRTNWERFAHTPESSQITMRGLSGRVWFRRDREGRGGVACAVKASLSPVHRPDLEPDCEVLAVQLGTACPAILSVCYRPPDTDTDVDKISDFLAVLRNSNLPFLVVGDLNLPEITW